MQIERDRAYRNKKTGKVYRVLAIASHSETLEKLVVYARGDNWLDRFFIWIAAIALKLSLALVWARPIDVFQEKFTEK